MCSKTELLVRSDPLMTSRRTQWMKPSELWTLCNDSDYGAIKHLLSAVHRNPAGASGGEKSHNKSANQVHSSWRARLGTISMVLETGTTILFKSNCSTTGWKWQEIITSSCCSCGFNILVLLETTIQLKPLRNNKIQQKPLRNKTRVRLRNKSRVRL